MSFGRAVSSFDADFIDIQKRWDEAKIERHTSDVEMAFVAGGLESVKARGIEGAVLECGCFTGFSSSCISKACHDLGFDFIVADSFLGLPDVGSKEYKPGEFACSMQDWQNNVARFGKPIHTTIEGWFRRTMQVIAGPIALLWMDVDLGQSVHDILSRIGSLIPEGGLIFSHETEERFFDSEGGIKDDTNEVWAAIKEELAGRKYYARFLCGFLGEVELLS